jgi:hypothetical protein
MWYADYCRSLNSCCFTADLFQQRAPKCSSHYVRGGHVTTYVRIAWQLWRDCSLFLATAVSRISYDSQKISVVKRDRFFLQYLLETCFAPSYARHVHIVWWRGVTIDGGFGLDIGFIDHLYTRLGTTSNYSATANLHNSQITSAPAKPFPACCVFTSRSLVTASAPQYLTSAVDGGGEWSASRPPLHPQENRPRYPLDWRPSGSHYQLRCCW